MPTKKTRDGYRCWSWLSSWKHPKQKHGTETNRNNRTTGEKHKNIPPAVTQSSSPRLDHLFPQETQTTVHTNSHIWKPCFLSCKYHATIHTSLTHSHNRPDIGSSFHLPPVTHSDSGTTFTLEPRSGFRLHKSSRPEEPFYVVPLRLALCAMPPKVAPPCAAAFGVAVGMWPLAGHHTRAEKVIGAKGTRVRTLPEQSHESRMPSKRYRSCYSTFRRCSF